MQYATCVAWREIRWTEDSEAHIARHDLTPGEVEEVVNTRPRLVEPGPGDIEELYGRTNADRYHVVILSEAADGRDFVVTARDLTDSERRSFLRRTT